MKKFIKWYYDIDEKNGNPIPTKLTRENICKTFISRCLNICVSCRSLNVWAREFYRQRQEMN